MTKLLQTAAVIAIVAVAGVGAFYAFGPPFNVASGPTSQPTQAVQASPTPSPTGETLPSVLVPSASPLPSRFPQFSPEVARGWPDTTENQPGVYSWDGSRCAGNGFCTMGFMHNGYGSGDVKISITVVPDSPAIDAGMTAVTVAGHDGIYRRIDAQREEWIVEIDGTTIAIRLGTRPGTSAADLAQAYAIIESMRYEPRDNDLGFRLVFTITTDEWDSG